MNEVRMMSAIGQNERLFLRNWFDLMVSRICVVSARPKLIADSTPRVRNNVLLFGTRHGEAENNLNKRELFYCIIQWGEFARNVMLVWLDLIIIFLLQSTFLTRFIVASYAIYWCVIIVFTRIFTYRLTAAQEYIKQSGAVGKYKIIGRFFSFMLKELKKVEEVKEVKKKFTRKNDKGREVVRFQFEISPAVWESLEEVQRVSEIPTKRELLNNALTLFKWAMKHKEKGHSIVAVDSNSNSYEIELPCFDAIEQNSQRKLRLVS